MHDDEEDDVAPPPSIIESFIETDIVSTASSATSVAMLLLASSTSVAIAAFGEIDRCCTIGICVLFRNVVWPVGSITRMSQSTAAALVWLFYW